MSYKSRDLRAGHGSWLFTGKVGAWDVVKIGTWDVVGIGTWDVVGIGRCESFSLRDGLFRSRFGVMRGFPRETARIST